MVSLKKRDISSHSARRPSRVKNLVLYWPHFWAQLILHFPIEANTCLCVLCDPLGCTMASVEVAVVVEGPIGVLTA